MTRTTIGAVALLLAVAVGTTPVQAQSAEAGTLYQAVLSGQVRLQDLSPAQREQVLAADRIARQDRTIVPRNCRHPDTTGSALERATQDLKCSEYRAYRKPAAIPPADH